MENEKTEITDGVFPNIQKVYEIAKNAPGSFLSIAKSPELQPSLDGKYGVLSGKEKIDLVDALSRCDELFTERGIECHIDSVSADVYYDGRTFRKGQHPSMQDSLFSLDDYYDEKIHRVELVMRCFFSGRSNVSLRVGGLYGDEMEASVSLLLINDELHEVRYLPLTEELVELFNVVQGIIVRKNCAGELKKRLHGKNSHI